jgi:hypothetical protein
MAEGPIDARDIDIIAIKLFDKVAATRSRGRHPASAARANLNPLGIERGKVLHVTRLVTHKNTGNLPAQYSALRTDK